MVTYFDPVQKIELSYHLDKNLLKKWDKIKDGNLIKHDSDRCYIVDGRERTGKSVFTFQQAKYLDPTFNLDRICFTPESFLHQIRTAPKGSVIVFDEAFRGLSSKSSQSKVNKRIVQAMMEMGQRNLIVFIVLPTFFLLELYPAVLRSAALFHVYKQSDGRRKFKIYNYSKKSKLYMIGKKKGFSYAQPKTKVRGSFFNKYTIDEQAYRNKKLKSLRESEVCREEEEKQEINKFQDQRNKLIKFIYEKFINSQEKIAKEVKPYGIDISRTTVGDIIRGKIAVSTEEFEENAESREQNIINI